MPGPIASPAIRRPTAVDTRTGPHVAPPAAVPHAPAVPPASGAGTPDAVGRAVATAVQAQAPGRDLAVDSRYDRDAGRAVYRVTDRRTGEILFESPPEELLRFFASTREPAGAPLVTLEA